MHGKLKFDTRAGVAELGRLQGCSVLGVRNFWGTYPLIIKLTASLTFSILQSI